MPRQRQMACRHEGHRRLYKANGRALGLDWPTLRAANIRPNNWGGGAQLRTTVTVFQKNCHVNLGSQQTASPAPAPTGRAGRFAIALLPSSGRPAQARAVYPELEQILPTPNPARLLATPEAQGHLPHQRKPAWSPQGLGAGTRLSTLGQEHTRESVLGVAWDWRGGARKRGFETGSYSRQL